MRQDEVIQLGAAIAPVARGVRIRDCRMRVLAGGFVAVQAWRYRNLQDRSWRQIPLTRFGRSSSATRTYSTICRPRARDAIIAQLEASTDGSVSAPHRRAQGRLRSFCPHVLIRTVSESPPVRMDGPRIRAAGAAPVSGLHPRLAPDLRRMSGRNVSQ